IRVAGKTPCGARQNRRRTAGPTCPETFRGHLRVSSHAAKAETPRPVQLQLLFVVWLQNDAANKDWGWKINDRHPEVIWGTEFGLPPSNLKGASETERPSLFPKRWQLCQLLPRGLLHLIDGFIDFLHGGVHLLQDLVLFPGYGLY